MKCFWASFRRLGLNNVTTDRIVRISTGTLQRQLELSLAGGLGGNGRNVLVDDQAAPGRRVKVG